MSFIYPCVFSKDEDGYSCFFPDLEGAFSCGDTLEEVLFNAKECLDFTLLSSIEEGESLPETSDIKSINCENNEFVNYIQTVYLQKLN